MGAAVGVLSMFAALWAVAGLISLQAPWPSLAAPVAVSLALCRAAAGRIADLPPRSPETERRIGRLVLIWTAVEGVGIFVAINVVINLHRPELTMAAVCAVVGLHFLPLARGLPQASYYPTGGALTALAAAGLVASTVVTPAVIGLGAALILWASVVALLRRAAQLARGSSGP